MPAISPTAAGDARCVDLPDAPDSGHLRVSAVWQRRLATALIVVAVATAAFTAPVFAHAGLVDTDPAPATTYEVGSGPTNIILQFTEDVSNPGDAIAVLDSSGTKVDVDIERIDAGTVSQPIALLAEDVYTVVYHIVSADGHPVHGAYTFTYGDPSADAALAADTIVDTVSAAKTRSASTALALAALENVLTLAAVGAAAVWALFSIKDRRSLFWAMVAALSASVVSLVGVLLEVYESTTSALGLRPTLAGLVRAGGALVLAGCATAVRTGSTRRVAQVAVVWSVAMLASYAAAGHGYSHGNSAANAVLLTVHLAAAALWLGAAPVIAIALYRPPSTHIASLTRSMRQFSTYATVALPLVVGAGGVLATVYTNARPTTGYGVILAAKIGMVACVALLGLRARRALATPQPLPIVRRTMQIEAAAVVAIAAISAGLTTMAPSHTSHAGHDGHDHSNHVSTTVDDVENPGVACTTPLGSRTLSVEWDGTGPGNANMHLYSDGGDGGEMSVRARHDLLGDASLDYNLVQYNAVHWMGLVELPFAGEWTLEFREQPDRFTVVETTCVVEVPAV